MEIDVIKPFKRKLVTPEFINTGLSLMITDGTIKDEDNLVEILDKFNKLFEVDATMDDIVPFFFVDLETEDIKTVYSNCIQFHSDLLNTI